MQNRKYSLKELRARQSLTQEEIAKLLGISRRSYIKLEKEPTKVKYCTLLEAARILKVDINEIDFK